MLYVGIVAVPIAFMKLSVINTTYPFKSVLSITLYVEELKDLVVKCFIWSWPISSGAWSKITICIHQHLKLLILVQTLCLLTKSELKISLCDVEMFTLSKPLWNIAFCIVLKDELPYLPFHISLVELELFQPKKFTSSCSQMLN